MTHCPCGSKKTFQNCCQPFIKKVQLPKTPEELMRSRFTAFTIKDINYLKETSYGKAKERFVFSETLFFANQAKWDHLTIIKSEISNDPNVGYVEFIAFFKIDSSNCKIHELSKFEKIDGKWFYCDGVHYE